MRRLPHAPPHAAAPPAALIADPGAAAFVLAALIAALGGANAVAQSALPGPTPAQVSGVLAPPLPPDAAACGRKTENPDAVLAACDRAINAGLLRARERSDALAARGGAFASKGEFDRAYADFNEAVRLAPEGYAALHARGLERLRRELWDGAQADLNAVVRFYPKRASSYLARAQLWGARRNFEREVADLDQAVKLAPKDGGIFKLRGWVWRERGDLVKAQTAFTTALKLAPNDAETLLARGQVRYEAKDLPGAYADFEAAWRADAQSVFGTGTFQGLLEKNPRDLHLLVLRARARQQLGDLAGALADYEEVLRAEPQNAEAMAGRGQARELSNDLSRAVRDYSEVIRSNPNRAAPYLQRAWAYRRQNQPDKALADLNTAVWLEPRFADAYKLRGLIWYQKANYPRAAADLDSAHRLDPSLDLNTQLQRAAALARAERGSDSLAAYDAIIRREPNNAAAYAERAQVRAAFRQDYPRALADYETAMRLDPANLAYYRLHATMAFQQGDYARAIADYDAAIRADPNEGTLLVDRGDIKFISRDYDGALADLDAALALNSPSMVSFTPVALIEKGLIRYAQGNFSDAAAQFADGVARAAQMARENPYANLVSQRAAVWLYLAQVRAGQRDEKEFAQNAAAEQVFAKNAANVALAKNVAALGADKSDEALAQFFLGKLSRDEFLAAQATSKARGGQAAQCVAPFFIGQWHLLRRETALARARFEEVRKGCPKRNVETLLSEEELRRVAP